MLCTSRYRKDESYSTCGRVYEVVEYGKDERVGETRSRFCGVVFGGSEE